MSEEILKALMQLFALIVKQGSGVQKKEIEFVRNFLFEQLNQTAVQDYLTLFEDFADLYSKEQKNNKTKSPSVKDSIKILAICKKINRTLTHKQKVIVIIRLFELINVDKKFTYQRMTIINTVAEVFNVAPQEFNDIEAFIKNDKLLDLDNSNILKVDHDLFQTESANKLKKVYFDSMIFILQVKSVDLYFLKHSYKQEVLLNGLVINPFKIYLFASGSSIRLPVGKPVYYSDIILKFRSDSVRTEIQYDVNNISLRFPSGEMGVQNVSFSENQDRLVGILGVSGAGKTTLLNILCGIEKPTTGKVLLNGQDIHSGSTEIKGEIGYIPQDDLLIEELTVFQNLFYNAKLCYKKITDKEISELTDQTLSNLGLLDKKTLKVGSPKNKIISGGERKRLNIAIELIRQPSILFVDEPTSGLSSRDSENVMDLLRGLSLKSNLVFVVIHQPSSELFKMFDNVLILDEGGQLIYYGNPIESIIYFKKLDAQINSNIGECPTCGNVNPELIFNIVDKKVVDEFGQYTQKRKVSPGQWAEYFRERSNRPLTIPTRVFTPFSSFNVPSWFKQFRTFITRDFLSKISNRQYVVLNLLEAPLLGFILSYIIYYIADPESGKYIFRENENIPIYIFMSLIVALFLALTISAEEIYRDRIILKRERFLKLSKGSYLLAKVIILLFISAFQTYLFVLIGNSILEIKGMNFYYWLALFTTAAFANLLGLNVSASFNSAITIYIIIPLLIIPMMVLSGAMFSFDKLNRSIGSVDKVPVIADLMATKWTYEALMVHQFKNNRFEKYFYELEKEESQADFQVAQKLPKLVMALEFTYNLFVTRTLTREQPGKLNLITNEISKKHLKVKDITFQHLDKLNTTDFNETYAISTKEYINKLQVHYGKKLTEAENKIEHIIYSMLKTDPTLYQRLKDQHFNESVSDIVKKRFERNRILEYKNRLIQQYHPIYQDPEPTHMLNFRTHFFAPRKYFFGYYFDTFWFNIFVVWTMTIILYITLYFDLLKKIFHFLKI